MDQRTIDSKQAMRKKLAALSFTEKIKILEKLRDRELVIAEARRKLREARAAAGEAAGERNRREGDTPQCRI